MDSLADMEAWVALLLERQARGSDLPFIVFHRRPGLWAPPAS
ncbi:MAG: hypothetical protein NTY23_06305 [Chloroflexi bacterium]|nr:hypothetical protein [Chloroflexota bacterium]